MVIIIPNTAEILWLKDALNHTAAENFDLKLFSNNITLSAATVIGDFTEVTGGGYALKSLTGSSWTVATNGSGEAEATYAAQTFTFTGTIGGSGIVYGYYYIQTTSGALMGCEKLASAFTPTVNGDAFTFTPTLQLFSEN